MYKVLNIPNCLSITRILLIPVIVLLILFSTSQNYPFLIGLFFFSILLDFFDGFLARKLSQETEIGKVLDPLADKLMIFCIVLVLIIKADFPLWLALMIFLRDFVILLASVLLMRGNRKVKPSILIGKVTFGVLGVLLLVYLIDLHQGFDLEILKRFFAALSFTYLIWSWVEYYVVYRREKNGEKK